MIIMDYCVNIFQVNDVRKGRFFNLLVFSLLQTSLTEGGNKAVG